MTDPIEEADDDAVLDALDARLREAAGLCAAACWNAAQAATLALAGKATAADLARARADFDEQTARELLGADAVGAEGADALLERAITLREALLEEGDDD